MADPQASPTFVPNKAYIPLFGRRLVGGKLSIVELDSKGRITLPKAIRQTVGIKGRVLAINAGDHLKIIPLPSNPIQSLDGVLALKKPFKELRKDAEELAVREAKRRHR